MYAVFPEDASPLDIFSAAGPGFHGTFNPMLLLGSWLSPHYWVLNKT